jgi:serine/threonine protein kinase
VRGEPDSPQRDIYSLGVILYEVLAGRRPFPARSEAELIYRITTERPQALRELNPEVPEDLEEIAMMAIDPIQEKRWSTAGALASELRSALRWHGSDLDRVRFGERVATAFSERRDLPTPIRQKNLAAVRRPNSQITQRSGADFEIMVVTSDVEAIGTADTDEIELPPLSQLPPMDELPLEEELAHVNELPGVDLFAAARRAFEGSDARGAQPVRSVRCVCLSAHAKRRHAEREERLRSCAAR